MTPEEAGASLRDDPTFALMSREEQEAEAELLLGTDDPLEIALAIEAALEAPAVTSVAAGTDIIEGCRLATPCGFREPIAGNGRCMTCGAYRAAAATEPVSEPKPSAPPTATPKPQRAVAPAGGDMVARFKAATNASDAAIADLIGLKRTTVSAYLSGRLKENVSGAGAAALLASARAQIEALEALADALTEQIVEN